MVIEENSINFEKESQNNYFEICRKSFKIVNQQLKYKDRGGKSLQSSKKLKEVLLDIQAIRTGNYLIE